MTAANTTAPRRDSGTVHGLVVCQGCLRKWIKGCQQTAIIAEYGTCAVCRYRDNPPPGMTTEQCEAELVKLFGCGPYFPHNKPGERPETRSETT
jgi:hypothetical protein